MASTAAALDGHSSHEDHEVRSRRAGNDVGFQQPGGSWARTALDSDVGIGDDRDLRAALAAAAGSRRVTRLRSRLAPHCKRDLRAADHCALYEPLTTLIWLSTAATPCRPWTRSRPRGCARRRAAGGAPQGDPPVGGGHVDRRRPGFWRRPRAPASRAARAPCSDRLGRLRALSSRGLAQGLCLRRRRRARAGRRGYRRRAAQPEHHAAVTSMRHRCDGEIRVFMGSCFGR